MVFSSWLTRKSTRARPEQSSEREAVLASRAIFWAVVGWMGAGTRRLAEAMPCLPAGRLDLEPDSYLSAKVRMSFEGTGCSQTEVRSCDPELPRTETFISLKFSALSSTIIFLS